MPASSDGWYERAHDVNLQKLIDFYGTTHREEIQRVYMWYRIEWEARDEPRLYVPFFAVRDADDDLRSRGFKRSTPLEQTEAISAAAA